MTSRRTHQYRAGAVLAVVATIAAACGSSEGSGGEQQPAEEPAVAEGAATTASTPSAPVSPTQPTSVPTSTAPATTAPATTAPATTAPPATAPATTEPCGSKCPVSETQQIAIDAFFAAYNGQDWDSYRSLLVDEEVSWAFSPTLVQNEELMRLDFVWSAGMEEVWTPVMCVDQYGVVSCTVEIEDALHRALAPYGFPVSICGIVFELEGEAIRPLRYDPILTQCHGSYDGAMHFFGEWFEEQYPDEDPIQGVHYRGWNQTDETAPARARAHIDEWVEAVVIPFVEDGGDIMSVSHH